MWSHVLLCHCESVQVCPSKWESLSPDRNLAVITSILGWRTRIFCAKTVVFQGVLGEVVFGIVKLAASFNFAGSSSCVKLWWSSGEAKTKGTKPLTSVANLSLQVGVKPSRLFFCHKTWGFSSSQVLSFANVRTSPKVQSMNPQSLGHLSSANRESGIISSQFGALTYGGWRGASTSVEEKMMEMSESFILVDTQLVKEKPYEGRYVFQLSTIAYAW